jgi:preprotein translocase subunit SecA
MVTKALVSAQKKVEGMNFDARKHLLDYDDVLNKQRTSVYHRRQQILGVSPEDLRQIVIEIIGNKPEGNQEEKERVIEIVRKAQNPEVFRRPLLAMLDTLWMNHLEDLESLRESVRIRAYGQHDPLIEYRRESHLLYRRMLDTFDAWIYENLAKLKEMPVEEDSQENRKTPEVVATELKMSPQELAKVGRNDPCPCGSGKKYKKCHGA